MRPPRSMACLLIVAALVLTACGRTDRPAAADWQQTWEAFLSEVPTIAELGSPPDRAVCSDGLGLVRESEGELLPTPDRAIDQAVKEWIMVADSAFFECPPSSSALPDLEYAYGQLARIEAEISAVLDIDRREP